MKKRYLPFILLSVFALSACDFNSPIHQTINVIGINLNESSITLEIAETETLVATITPSDATNQNVNWTISDSDIATVTQNGLVTAYSGGQTTVTVTTVDGSFTDTCLVTVNSPVDIYAVSSVSLNQTSLAMIIDDTTTLIPTVFPNTATNKNVTWSSSNSAIASVDNSGLLSAVAEGNATITVTTVDGGFTATCAVRVSSDINNPDQMWDATQDSQRTGTKNLDFYNLNDFHGATEFDDDSYEPGIKKLSTYLKNAQSQNEDGFVLTSSGDMWQGSADSNITRGRLVNDWMGLLDFSAMALGNHEFDWTIDVINNNQASATFPYLACNIIEDDTHEPVSWAQPYTTITRKGVHIGIIGAIGEGITNDILATNVEGLSFADPTSYVSQWSTYLRSNGADIILYLLHDSITNISYTEGSAVDAIFGGHTHTGETNVDSSSYSYVDTSFSAPAIQAWSNGKDVGHISLTYNFSTSSISSEDGEILDTRSFTIGSLVDDSATATLYQTYLDNEISAIKDAVYLEDGPGIDRNDIPNIYNQYAYKFFKDVKDTSDAYDIFAIQTNNARASIASGDITYGMIYKALPFDNYLYLVSVRGSDIVNTLSNYGYFYLPSQNSQVSGYNLSSYVNSSQTYYMLMIDYIALKSPYCDVVTPVATYTEEAALPRNIVSHYIGSYPSNIN
ncbi:MAG: Ig-like domain-containing protein [Bacilli bacterium]